MKRVHLGIAIAAFALGVMGCGKPVEGGTSASGGKEADGSASLPTEVTLRLKGSVGDKYTMVTTMETSADVPGPEGKPISGSMTMTSTEENTCTKVEGNKMTWESKNVDVQASGTGPFAQQAEMMKSQEKGKTTSKVRDERNQVIEAKGPEQMALVFPEKAVKVGDTWTGESDMMGQKVKIDFKLDRFESLGGKTVAVLVATITGSDTLKMSEPLTIHVDTEKGWPVKGAASFEMTPQPGVTAKIKVKMEAK